MKVNNNLLKYKNFCGLIGYSEADRSYFGRLLGIAELITFKGRSKESIQLAFFDAVDNYLFSHDTTNVIPTAFR